MADPWKRSIGGLYTPVISTPVSCSALTATPHLWTMHPDTGIVTVSGRVDFTNSSLNTTASFIITLPTPWMNNFQDGNQAFGSSSAVRIPATAAQGSGYCVSIISTKTAQIVLAACPISAAATGSAWYSFQYASIQP